MEKIYMIDAIMLAAGLLTLTETCKLLQISMATLRRRIKDGSIKTVKLGPHRNSPCRVPIAGLAEWMNGNGESKEG